MTLRDLVLSRGLMKASLREAEIGDFGRATADAWP
jgi:hypothetical protein